MILVLGIIFLIFLIFLFDWIISSEKEIFKEKIRTVIVIFSILLSILFLFFGLYYFSTFFVSLAIWFFKRKVFFDLIMRLFKKKNNSSIPLSEAYDYTGDVMVENMLYRDTEEGISAFIEKRDPNWTQ